MDVQNKCLLGKWLFKFYNEQGVWQELLRNKYLNGKTLSQVSKKAEDSHFWKSLLSNKDMFLSLGSFKLGSGEEIRFWEDKWLGNRALKEQYPNIFNIVRKKSATVADVLRTNPYNVSLRRSLVGIKLREWQSLVAKLANINLVEGNDSFVWSLQKSGLFTVNSMYRHMINNGTKVTLEIWRTKIPLKIKVFIYYLKRGVILTKDNLSKRLWVGSKLCSFCCNAETIQHLFFECYYAKFLSRAVFVVLRVPPL